MNREWDATTYDRIADPMAEWGRTVVERFSPPPHALVLDAGCGSGRVTEMLLRLRPDIRVIALDGSSAMIEAAEQRLHGYRERVEFLTADLTAPLPIPEVDAILSTATFHWIHDHTALFANLASVTRSGGPLCAQWGGIGNLERVAALLAERGIDYHREVHFAHPHVTRERLAATGWEVRDVWVHEAPVTLPDDDALDRYLRTVILRSVLEPLTPEARDELVAYVVRGLPDRVLDYVRINADATRT